jgi:hypothetical protein
MHPLRLMLGISGLSDGQVKRVAEFADYPATSFSGSIAYTKLESTIRPLAPAESRARIYVGCCVQ